MNVLAIQSIMKSIHALFNQMLIMMMSLNAPVVNIVNKVVRIEFKAYG